MIQVKSQASWFSQLLITCSCIWRLTSLFFVIFMYTVEKIVELPYRVI